jgi:hypothetical protein
MTLAISIFIRAASGDIARDELFADRPGAELAGVEATRTDLWGVGSRLQAWREILAEPRDRRSLD